MDWIDPRYATQSESPQSTSGGKRKGKKKKGRGRVKSLSTQVTAALAQPLEVWGVAFDHGLSRLQWPNGCSAEGSFLWSALMQEQAEVLVRAGMSARRLSAIVADRPLHTNQDEVDQLAEVVGLMDQSLESLAFEWLNTVDAYAHSALGVAALAWHLPDHARRPGNEWLTQWVQSVSGAIDEYHTDDDEPVLCHLVMRCELPLLIGLATSASKRTILGEASRSMDALAEYLEGAEDNPAPWLVHGGTYLRASLASVLRCRVLANALGLRKWYPPQQKALSNLLKHAARWARPDGTQLLAAGVKAPRSNSFWQALVSQAKKTTSQNASMCLSGIGTGKRSQIRREVSIAKLPALTHYSSGAANACMQCDWRQKGGRVAIDFSDQDICLEALGPKGVPLLAGEWTTKVELEGQAQMQLDEWGEVCWFSDDDVDYLELQAEFGQKAKVQRQVALFRQERMLFVSDALLAEEPGQWSLSSNLPLANDVSFEEEAKTTEGFLTTESGNRCLAIPLFLPEWKRSLATLDGKHQFTAAGESLVTSSSTSRQRLYKPTLISLCNSHAKKPYTWRHLTVADELRIVGPEEAVAYRIQVGLDQWLLYRSLDEPIRRTTLGMHTMSDFYAGRFDSDEGEVDTIVEVDPA